MGSGKRQESDEAVRSRMSSVFSGPGGVSSALIVGVAFFLLIVGGVVFGWRSFGQSVVARPIYRIKKESIRVTPPPPWIRSDIRAEIVHDGALNDLTVFDKDATIRVYQAFELHPWVAKVLRVSKHPPAQLIVDLEYRQPVAWVEVVGSKPGDEGGVIPIDSNGYVLPSRDFTKENLKDYVRISVKDVRPYGLAGTAWGDPRVVGAAKIATLLRPNWQSLHVYRILLTDDYDPLSAQTGSSYEIETDNQRRIVWGSAPGAELGNEPSAAVKVARLLQLVESVGSLDKLPEAGTDLRTLDNLRTALSPFERTHRR